MVTLFTNVSDVSAVLAITVDTAVPIIKVKTIGTIAPNSNLVATNEVVPLNNSTVAFASAVPEIAKLFVFLVRLSLLLLPLSSSATANTATDLAATDLEDGVYRVYTVDIAGNISTASTATVTIDT
jgi:hypothetical protein